MFSIFLFFYIHIICFVGSLLINNCQDFGNYLKPENSSSYILLDTNETCLLNEVLSIPNNLMISSIHESKLILKNNFSAILSPKANLSIINFHLTLDFRYLTFERIFELNNSSVLILINVSFQGSSKCCKYSLIRGFFMSQISLFSCNFSNINFHSEFPLIEIINYSNLTLENVKILNFSSDNSIISMKFSSLLKVSGLQVLNSSFFPENASNIFAVIENDYSSFLSSVLVSNISFSSTFLSISSTSNLNLTILIRDCKFSQVFNENTSKPLIFLAELKNYSLFNIQNCSFLNNQASFSFFSISVPNVIIKELYFDFNHANFSIFYGYNIYFLNVSDTIITRQNSNETGMRIWLGSCFILKNSLIKKFDNITISNSSVNDSCVGIQFHDTENILFLNFGNYFLSNENKNGQIEIQNSYFSDNYVFYRKNGNISGVLYVDSDSQISIINCLFQFNIINSIPLPEKNIGAPCLNSFSTKNNLSIINSILRNNSAKFISNCITFQGFEMKITYSLFDNNVPFFGEELMQQYNYLKSTYARVTEALPYGFGGAVHFLGEVLYISDSFFSNNQGYTGAGLLIDGTEFQRFLNFTIESTIFYGNSAGTLGGGIYITPDVNNLNGLIENCIFLFNDGRYGGGITTGYYSKNDYLLIDNSFFYQNQAQYAGSVMAHQIKGVVNITRCNFFENKGFLPSGMILPVMCGGVGLWGELKTFVYSKNNYYLKNFANSNVAGAVGLFGGNFFSVNDTYEKIMAYY